MTDAELWAAAWAELEKTTDPYSTWKLKGFPVVSHWAKAKALGERIGVISRPPSIAPPLGPFTLIEGGGSAKFSPSAFLRTTVATEIKGLHVRNMSAYGVGSMQPKGLSGRLLISDCIVENVAANPPRGMNGTGEACFWLGNMTTASRIVARNGAWAGIWTGAKCSPTIIEDFVVECPHIGIYVAHVSAGVTFRRGSITTEKGNGINVDWWYGGGGASGLLFEDLEIYCPQGHWGALLGAGTFGCLFRRCRFWGPSDAIALPKHLKNSASPNVVAADCVFENGGHKVFYHDNTFG